MLLKVSWGKLWRFVTLVAVENLILMESTEESVQEYTEADGTRVIKRTIIKRIKPSNAVSSKSSWNSGSNAPKSGPATTLDVADPKSMNNFEVAFLNKHNEYRKLHGVPPLQLSREVFAQFIGARVLIVKVNLPIALQIRARMGHQHCLQKPTATPA